MCFVRFFRRNHTFLRMTYTGSSRPSRRPVADGISYGGERGIAMQLDKKSLDRLLKLNDDQLRTVLTGLLAEYGVDVSRVPLASMDMGAIRAVLRAATDADIANFLQAFGSSSTGMPNGAP